MMEVGRVCMKLAGREAGKHCVIIKKIDDTFVTVTGPKGLTGVKRRRCNVDHLEPLDFTVDIKADAPDSEVESAMKKEKVLSKIPSAVRDVLKKEKTEAKKAPKGKK